MKFKFLLCCIFCLFVSVCSGADLNILMGLNYTYGGFQPCAFTYIYLLSGDDYSYYDLGWDAFYNFYSNPKKFIREFNKKVSRASQVIRTDSQGRACFTNIPNGTHAIIAIAPTRKHAVMWEELIVVDGKKVYDFSHNKEVEIKDFLLLDGSNVSFGE